MSSVTYSMTFDAEEILERESYRASLDGLNETGLNMVPIVGGVAITTEPPHPGMGNEGMRHGCPGLRPVSGLVVADERVPTEIHVPTIVARLTDHLTESHDYHVTPVVSHMILPLGVQRTGMDLGTLLLQRTL